MKKYRSLIIIFSALTFAQQLSGFYLFWRFHWDIDFLIPIHPSQSPQSLETIAKVIIPHLFTQLTLNFILAHFLLIQDKSPIKYTYFFAYGIMFAGLFNVFSSYIVYYTGLSVIKALSFLAYQFFFLGVLVLIFKSFVSTQDQLSTKS